MMKRHAIFISVLFLLMLIIPFLAMGGTDPVSYTHLDVYKRQVM